MPWVEGLEDRRLLATITWSTTNAPTGGDWNNGQNWTGGNVPGPQDTAVIKGLTGSGIVSLNTPTDADSVIGVTTDSSVNLQVESGSLSLGIGSPSAFGGPVSVGVNGTLNFNAGASVSIADDRTLSVAGQLTVTGASVVVNKDSGYAGDSDGIVVNSGGTMTATGSSFTRNTCCGDAEVTDITVATGGHLVASGSTFSLDDLYLDGGLVLKSGDLSGNILSSTTLYAPIADIALLTDNQSFAAVYLTGGLTSGESVTLAPMGTQTTAGQYYVLPNNLTVAAGQSLTIDDGAAAATLDDQTLSVAGQLTVTDASVVFDKDPNYAGDYDAIVVNSGGTMTATGASFVPNQAGDAEVTDVTVATGGHLVASGSTFSVDDLYLDGGLVLKQGDITGNILSSTTLYAPIADIALLTNNQSFNAVYLTGGLTSGESVTLAPMGTQTTAGQYYVLPSNLTVAAGQSLTIDDGAAAATLDDQTLSVAGQLTVTDASVVFDKDPNYAGDYDGIVIDSGGTMTATGASFVPNQAGYAEVTDVTVATGGHLVASGSTFSVDDLYLDGGLVLKQGDITGNILSSTTLYAPIADIALLTNNQSFNAVYLTGGLTSGESVTLAPMGTQTTAGQYYVLPSNLTVAAGQSLTIDDGAAAATLDDQTLSVAGQLTVTDASVVFDKDPNYAGDYDGIVIDSGGTMTATGASFVPNQAGYAEVTDITVGIGGHLVASGSTFSVNNLYLDGGLVLKQGDITGNILSSTTLYAPIADIALLTNNQSFNAVYLTGGLTSGESVTLAPMGTQTTAGQYYVLPSNLTVAAGQSLTIDDGAAAATLDDQTLSVAGQLTVTDASVVFDKDPNYAGDYDAIVVGNGGTMTATGASFVRNQTGYAEVTDITVGIGGHLVASGSTFSVDDLYLDGGLVLKQGDITGNILSSTTLYAPIADIALLTNNQSFNAVYLTGGLTSGESVTLAPMGTQTTAGQYYVLPSNLTVAAGQSLTIAAGASLTIANTETLTVSGQLTVTDATVVIDKDSGYGSDSDGIVVSNGGTMTATGSSFVRDTCCSYSENTYIQVNSGGSFSVTGSTVSLDNLTFSSGSNDTLSTVVLSGTFNVNSGATVNIVYNDFSNMANQSVVASGTQGSTIVMEHNFWARRPRPASRRKILDGNTAPTSGRPIVDFQNWLKGSSGTEAIPLATTFSPTVQTINLTANVTTTGGVTITEGTETFTILNGTEVIGTTTAPVNVGANGSATATYTLPKETAAGVYIIEANYLGSADYPPAVDTSHFLTINPAGTVTTTVSAQATYSAAADQTVSLSTRSIAGPARSTKAP